MQNISRKNCLKNKLFERERQSNQSPLELFGFFDCENIQNIIGIRIFFSMKYVFISVWRESRINVGNTKLKIANRHSA